MDTAEHTFRISWNANLDPLGNAREAVRNQFRDAVKQIKRLVNRIVDASGQSAIAAYEKRLDKLDRGKAELAEQLEK